MNQPTLNIKMSVNDANTILKGLSALPFVEVAEIITAIKVQGEEQVNAANAPPVVLPVAEEDGKSAPEFLKG